MGPARGQLWGWGQWDQLEDSSGGGTGEWARGQLWGWGGWDQVEDSSGGGADGTS